MKKFAMTASICFAIGILGGGGVQAGQLIDVGLGNSTATGAGVIGNTGDTWNQLGTGTLGPVSLVNSSGAATGVSVSVHADGGGGGFHNTSPNTSISQSYDWTASGTPISVSLTGLTPGGEYQLDTYSITDPCCGTTRPGTVAMAAANGGASEIVTADPSLSTWVLGSNYGFFDLKADGSGDINFSVTRINGEADLNGFQLQAVPEPTSLAALLGAAAIGLVAARRSRRRKKFNA